MTVNEDALKEGVQVFRNLLSKSFELETEHVDAIVDMWRESVTEVAPNLCPESTSPTKRRSKPKKFRKKSGYNLFVRQKMQTDDIKALDHKERLKEVAKLWQSLSEDDKQGYKNQASEENTSATTVTSSE